MSDAGSGAGFNFDRKTVLVILAVAGVGVGATLLKSGPAKVEQVDVATKPIEVGSDQINQINIKDKDAALTSFSKQFEVVDQQMTLLKAEQIKREESLRKELKEDSNSIKASLAALSNDIIGLRADGPEAVYTNANKSDNKTLPTIPPAPSELPNFGIDSMPGMDGLNFDMSAPKPQQDQTTTQAKKAPNPYGPNYFILKPDTFNSTVSKKSGGDSLSASEEEMFSSMSTPAAQNSDYSNKASGSGPAQAAPQPATQEYANAAEAYKAQQQAGAQGTTGQVASGPRMKRITIPAFSFVEVTVLHGVACPVGANSPNSKSQSEIPARPVVLPVRGIFRGPNASSVDVGNIHLMGLCSGRRTSSSSSGRATIRVEQMSYWDEVGDAQMSTSTGYLVDTRDNEQDVYGRLDKASGRTLALESAAAAGAAFASALSQAEYTTQNNLTETGGSTSVQQLTGSATKAATTQGVAAIFQKIASRFEQEANSAIDTVVVEPGIRLRFVTDQPIHVYQPAEAFDLDSGKSDVLL